MDDLLPHDHCPRRRRRRPVFFAGTRVAPYAGICDPWYVYALGTVEPLTISFLTTVVHVVDVVVRSSSPGHELPLMRTSVSYGTSAHALGVLFLSAAPLHFFMEDVGGHRDYWHDEHLSLCFFLS